MTGHIAVGMWIGMASLVMAPSEREGSYRSRVKFLLASTPIAGCGYLMGFIQDWSLWFLVPLMALLAFVTNLISALGAFWSVGGMQFLLVSSIALGVPGVNWWEALGWYFCGVAFYLLMLLVEAALNPHGPERNAVSGVLASLIELARVKTEDLNSGDENTLSDKAVAEARIRALSTIEKLREMEEAGQGLALERRWVAFAVFIEKAESICSLIVGCQDRNVLERLTVRLEAMRRLISQHSGKPVENLDYSDKNDLPVIFHKRTVQLMLAMRRMRIGVGSSSDDKDEQEAFNQVSFVNIHRNKWRLVFGRDTLMFALRLSIVFGAAVAARAYFPLTHWYWVPLTVCLVMKPDFGSIFVRAILRVIGTALGVLISTAVIDVARLPVLHEYAPLVIAAAITVLAALMPWFKLRSYALMSMAMTPIVVLLMSAVHTGITYANYSEERLLATMVGSFLVLVLGYAFWPGAWRTDVSGRLEKAIRSLSDYINACIDEDSKERHAKVIRARHFAYQHLADLRLQLQRSLGEAPPACTLAQVWLPAVSSMEQIVDAVGAVAEQRLLSSQPPPLAVAKCDEWLRLLKALQAAGDPVKTRELADELRNDLLAAVSV